jgi:hypothetical protein
LCGGTEENLKKKKAVRIAVLGKIQMEHLLHTSLECYHYAIPFGLSELSASLQRYMLSGVHGGYYFAVKLWNF